MWKCGLLILAPSSCAHRLASDYGIIKKQTFYIKVGETQKVNNMYQTKIDIRHFFRDSLEEFRTKKFTPTL